MDIRNWLQPKNKKAVESKKRRIEDDDDDVIPESPEVQIINKKKKTSHNTHTSKNKNKPEKEKFKEVKATNLFGNAPIKRTEPIVKKEPKKTETGIHSDEEFEKSLLDLDIMNQLEPNDQKNNVDIQKTSNDSQKTFTKISNEDKEKSNYNPKHSIKSQVNGNHATEITPSKSYHDKPCTSKDSFAEKVNNIKKEIKETNKRKFAEFLEVDEKHDSDKKKKLDSHIETKKTNGDVIMQEKHDSIFNDSVVDYEESKNKKKQHNKSLNESVLTDEERHERKMHSAKLYQSYLNRSGPKNLGAKEMPEGASNCLKDFAFLLTGVLDSFERDEIVDTINKYGGCVKNGISKKVTHVLAGDDAGPAKMAKAQELGIKIINEDDFLKIIKDSHKQKAEHKKERKDGDHSRKSSRENENSHKQKAEHKKERKDGDHSRKSSRENENSHKQKAEHKKERKDGDHSRKSSRENENSHKQKAEHKKERKDGDHSRKSSRENEKRKSKDKDHVNSTSSKSDVGKEKSEHKDKRKRDDTEDKKEKSDQKFKDSSKKELNVKEKSDKSKSPSKVDVVKIDKNLKSESESQSCTSIDKEESKSATDVKNNADVKTSNIMWVEKHKPQNVKQIIGQLGENSNVNKLINWLTKWYTNRGAKLPKPSPWAKNDDGGYFKAALLSGPPGVGKTTTVALVCKQLGFDTVEFNASDTRNKTLIREQIGELLTTSSLSAYAKGDTGKQAVTKKHVLVMDEVDGMAGNEDRGGLQELIGLIKSTSVPIICMCNDRNSQKMRSLVNYCYDLRFNRPKVEQIKAAMRSICCRENIKIPPDVLGQLIVSANQDVRQTMNLLSMWAIDPSRMDADRLTKDAAVTKKDVKLGPWEAIRKVFSAEDHKTMSINDKSDLFFYDYSLAPLFVQENYLQVQPHCPKHEVLQRISQAADCIAIGDVIDKRIRSSQAWSLLPMQAMYSSVLPGHYLSGHMAGQIQFPGWLGKNSRANKLHRLCQEIHAHTRLSTTGSKSSIYLDYASHLRDAIITPLVRDRTDGIEPSIRVLESYNLLREDLDSLIELSVWPGQRNPAVLIDSKVKAAMTRTYNKKANALPYAPAAVKRSRTKDDGLDEDEELEEDEPDSSDPENDGLIKLQKKKSQQSDASSSSDKSSTSKGKSNSKGSSGKGKKK